MIRLTLASYESIKYACEKYHYAKTTPRPVIAFNVYEDDTYCGVIVYGYGANPQIAGVYNKWQGQVLELVRVALNGKQKLTSECVAMSLKLLKKFCPLVDIVVSYADVDQSHKGIIYQATNWIYVGLLNEGVKGSYIIRGKKYHSRTLNNKNWKQSLEWIKLNIDKNATQLITGGKHKYLYPLNKKMRKVLSGLALDYPK